MPLDHSRRLDQYNRVDDLRPNPVEPHPQQPIERRKLRPAGSLSPQHGQLMTHGDQLNFQRGAAAKTEGEERNNGGENRPHDQTVRLAGENHQPFSALWRFEQGQVLRHQVTVLQRKLPARVQLTNANRLFFVQLYRWFPSILKNREEQKFSST